jgi:hypothetical protein
VSAENRTQSQKSKMDLQRDCDSKVLVANHSGTSKNGEVIMHSQISSCKNGITSSNKRLLPLEPSVIQQSDTKALAHQIAGHSRVG